MKGHIRERTPGRWAIVLESRDPETGKRRRKWHSFAGTKRAAQVECARLVLEVTGGTAVDPSRETVAVFLGRWLEHMAGQVAPRTLERYGELVHNHLMPLLGSLPLAKLQRGLSPRTVHHLHRVLRQALQQAVDWNLIARNPADRVKPPRVERRQMRTLDADGTVALLEAARGTDMIVPILLGVLCGLRRGEVAALRWRSIDLEAGTLAVVASTEQTTEGIREKETKSGKGRSIVLPALVADELRQHRIRQAEALLGLGVRLADDHHVVARADGQPLQPRSLTHAFVKFIRRHGFPQIRLHDLRHSHATHMLASGVHPKIAQERLGHSSVSVTIDLYSHVLPGMQAEAVSRVDAAMQDALNRRAAKNKW